jgi:PTS system ascorbate-specific IIA component
MPGRKGVDEDLEVITVCGVGMGTSLIMRMTAEEVFKALGLRAHVLATDVSSARGMPADMLIGQSMHTSEFVDGRVPIVVTVDNFIDKVEMREKILAGLSAAGWGDAQTPPTVGARVHVRAGDGADAVLAAAQLLVDTGAATPAYADRCVQIVRDQGPYIVALPGVALAHARPEDGARAVALTAVTLAVPVRFGHAANDPVDVVLAFASPDHDAHAGMLSALAHRLADGLGDKLRAATSNGDAVAVLNEVIEDVRTPVR